MTGRAGHAALSVVLTGLGCAPDTELAFGLDTFSVAFLVHTDNETQTISGPLIHRDLQIEGTEYGNPEIKLKDGEQFYVVALPEQHDTLEPICWQRPVSLREPTPYVDRGRLIAQRDLALPEETTVLHNPAFEAGSKEFGDMMEVEVPWLDSLVLQAEIDSESERASLGNLVPFEAATGLKEVLEDSMAQEIRPVVQEVRPFDEDRLLVVMSHGLALVTAGRPYQATPQTWLPLDLGNRSVLVSAAITTSTSGTEIVAIAGARLLDEREELQGYAGALVWARWTETRGLHLMAQKLLGAHQLFSIDLEGDRFIISGSHWPNETEPTSISDSSLREPVIYRGTLLELLTPATGDTEEDDFAKTHASPITVLTNDRRGKAPKAIFTGHPQFSMAVTTKSAVHVYDEQGTWQEGQLLKPSVTNREQDYDALVAAEDNPNEWWTMSDYGIVYRTVDAGQNWREVEIHYPPRFQDCGIFNQELGFHQYIRKSITDAIIWGDFVFMTLKDCAAMVAIKRSCVAAGPENIDQARCVSLHIPPGHPDDKHATYDQPCDESSEARYRLATAQTDREARMSVALFQDRLVVAVADGTLFITQAP